MNFNFYKTKNILIRNNELKIADFGISRVMNSGGSIITSGVGSPAYMSPEKIRGEDYGPPRDIWYFILFSIKLNLKHGLMIKGRWV
jgi:serine/threonine protein kinase